MAYAYNYGRPLENYRDRFSEAVTAALRENFEVLSVTFNGEHMQSKPTAEPGWRATPYAWLLLKAKGPQIDRIPAVQIDFDFIDTSGYTVLPVGSSPVAVDASVVAEARPYSELQVTQLLDERRADEGKVTLEIKATAKGLVPDLETILQLDTPGFTVSKRDDQGASVTRFADDQSGIVSERVFLLSLTPADEGGRPASFVFGKPRDADTKAVFQRYNDHDLETVSPEVALTGHYGGNSLTWLWVLLVVGVLAAGAWFLFRPARADLSDQSGLHMPKQINPFTVLGLLQQVAARTSLDEAQQQILRADIARIEQCHFGRAEDPNLDLAAVAQTWLRRCV
jgi:hypothetical protein